jgi:alpha-methylacyl-CoA racemase
MGPLNGIRIIEFAGIGPGPLCGTFLGDMGADVVRIDRAGPGGRTAPGAGSRSRRSVALNLKDPEAIKVALRLIETADGMFEPFRPGVMERLGLGPDVCLARNPKLVYGRMTGWGQDGPLANAAGHDINYIALTGALHAIGTKAAGPIPPLNLIGDFGGGTMLLAFGMVWTFGSSTFWERASRRYGDGRWGCDVARHDLRDERQRDVDELARGQHARWRRAFLRLLRNKRREAYFHWFD